MRFLASKFYFSLKGYKALNLQEEDNRKNCLALMRNLKDPFNRHASPRHFTATACIVDKTLSYILIVKHQKLQKWILPGGHCDGEQDTVKVARTEAEEETGLTNLKLVPGIFDIEIYGQNRKDSPSYSHIDHDITHLFIGRVDDKMTLDLREVAEAKWVRIDDILRYNDEPVYHRMLRKLRKMRNTMKRHRKKELKLNGWK